MQETWHSKWNKTMKAEQGKKNSDFLSPKDQRETSLSVMARSGTQQMISFKKNSPSYPNFYSIFCFKTQAFWHIDISWRDLSFIESEIPYLIAD